MSQRIKVVWQVMVEDVQAGQGLGIEAVTASPRSKG